MTDAAKDDQYRRGMDWAGQHYVTPGAIKAMGDESPAAREFDRTRKLVDRLWRAKRTTERAFREAIHAHIKTIPGTTTTTEERRGGGG